MKLTKQLKTDLAKAYQCTMEVSILDMKAPLRYINQYIAENVSGFGTAADEKIKSREGFRKMVIAGRLQSKEMIFNAKTITPYRPKFIDDTTAQFRDEIVVQIGDKKNKHSLHLWFSTLFKYQHNKWKLVMFHGSMPDATSSTEDTFHVREREKKLKELELVVAQRTADLQMKTRELAIEASLERVRTVTMSMNKPGDILNICKVFFTELQTLDFKDLRNTLINFWDDENRLLHDYDYSDFAGGNFAKLSYSSHPAFEAFQKKIRKAKDAFAKLVINKDGLKSWQQRRRSSGEYKDPRLSKISALYYYFYSTGVGALGISTFSPISKEEEEVLKKFRNVFDMAYKRYVDIQKSEAQSRESETELALERVRARTMAMQKSDELKEVIQVVYDQFVQLNIRIEHTGFILDYKERDDMLIWLADKHGVPSPQISIPYFDSPHWNSFLEAKKKKKPFFANQLDFKTKNKFYKQLFKLIPGIPKETIDFYQRCPGLTISTVLLDNVGLYIENFEGIPYTDEENDVLMRIGKVFQQTYTRFLDLQKAEAQAKEAQIEAALERVRAKAMAMHSSKDLSETLTVFYRELKSLGVVPRRCGIAIMDKAERLAEVTTMNTTEQGDSIEVIGHIKMIGHKILDEVYKNWLKQKEYHAVLKGNEIKQYYQVLKPQMDFPDYSHDIVQYGYYFMFKEGDVYAWTEKELSEDELKIYRRFTTVISLMYKRYKDLQHAEAQAREAQIEAALERVRSRSMGMQKSDELKEVIKLVYEQLTHLKIKLDHAGFVVDYKPKGDWTFWIADERDIPSKITHPYFESVWANQFNEAKEKGTDFFATHLNFEEKNKFYNELLSYVPGLPKVSKDFYLNCPGLAATTVLFKNIALYIENFSGTPYTEEENTTLMRFGKVFQQTYTRFLDLQKAEAQAREAKIEAALERTRTQSMIMQHSNELDDTLRVFHKQVLLLGINSAFSFLWLPDEEKDRHIFWAVWEEFHSFKSKAINYPIDRNEPATAQCLVDWKGKESVVSYHVPPTGVESYFAAWQELIAGVEQLKPENYADGLYYVEAFMKFGCFGVMVKSELPEEEKKILYRFAIEFERAYTRFLDLQKAEAQAREAQIEAALERVRSRSMAMHKSEELADLSLELVKQVQALGVATWFCAFNIYEDDPQGSLEWGSNGQGTFPSYRTPREGIFLHYYEAGQKGETLLINEIGEDECPAHYEYLCTLPGVGDILLNMKADGIPFPASQIDHVAFFKYGYIIFITYEPVPESHDIFKRFANVFEQTYTRFLDLQKAEAQAKEAKIESALERVRSRSLAMHHSSELSAVVDTLLREFTNLEFTLTFCIINLIDEQDKSNTVWAANPETGKDPESYYMKFEDYPFHHAMWDAWKEQKKNFIYTIEGEEKKIYDEYLFTKTEFRRFPKHVQEANKALKRYVAGFTFFKYSGLQTVSENQISEDELKILERFGRVFEQSYTRFLDLQKAEAQAREAQIEAALERVRSRSLAMHSSGELGDVVTVVLNNLMELGYIIDQGSAAHLVIFSEGTKDFVQWSADPALPHPVRIFIPYTDLPILTEFWDARQKGHDFFARVYSFDEKNTWFNFAFEHSDLKHIPGELKKLLLESETYAHSIAIEKNSAIIINSITGNQLSENQIDILRRFSKVFEQAYVRFLDLQKAEAQAREAQIETALEKVRSRTMAMQQSNELGDVATVLFKEMNRLVKNLWTCGFVLCEKDRAEDEWWLSTESGFIPAFYLPNTGDRVHENLYTGWKKGEAYRTEQIEGAELELHYEWLMSIPVSKKIFDDFAAAGFERPTWQKLHAAYFSKGYLCIITREPCPEEEVFKRFAQVFDLTYTRFLDLQKAEAQAREAKIEAALERIRGKVTSMQESTELLDIVVSMRNEFVSLGHQADYFWYMRWLPEKYEKAMTSGDGTRIGMVMTLPRHIHGDIKLVADWEKGDEPSVVLAMNVDTAVDYIDKMIRLGDFTQVDHNAPTLDDIRHIGGLTFVMARTTHGEIGYSLAGVVSNPPAEDVATLVRFAGVFDLAYRRFEDLKNAEAQNREAKIELALERVRARTMGMQRSDELPQAATLLFQQIQTLGLPAFAAGYCIWDDDKQAITLWMSSENVLQPPFKAPTTEDELFIQMRKGYEQGKSLHVVEMGGKDLVAHYKYMRTLPVVGQIFDSIEESGHSLPVFQVMHQAYFSKGFLLFITYEPVPASHDIFLRFANVFDQTYTRFLDLQKAEAQALRAEQDLIEIKVARKKAEEALTELQTTQKQLIQAEKMASLGELTAGIAHEIQNPLNFVNNFSEVSKELLEEMKESIEKGDAEEAIEIMNDVIQNLEKINHHGKRADGIVKGMLQHSRSSSGTKEPTDINALADEYLRLAYHGLRAKDKSFNATMKTDFDETIGNINIIPQDMGRVILNLITNAFYVVDEKKTLRQAQGYSYEPTVSVSTKKVKDKVEIKVKDNGNGIPQKVLEKIFQPFFTTKPTGQGTGLGLSLSYDIVKAHGGEITVDSKENIGTEFKISLPI